MPYLASSKGSIVSYKNSLLGSFSTVTWSVPWASALGSSEVVQRCALTHAAP